MLIDITDANIEKINFKRNYDTQRYIKGRDLFERMRVAINEVYTSNDIDYTIRAAVKGNSDIYDVQLDIRNTYLEKASCTCPDDAVYCKHILATCMEAVEPHIPSTDAKRSKLIQDRRKELEEQIRRREEQEKQRRKEQAYRRKYGAAIAAIDSYKLFNITDNINIQSLYEKAKLMNSYDAGELKTNIVIEPRITVSYGNVLKVDFKIGSGKMYTLKDMEELYNAFANGSIVTLGKNFRFEAKRENIEPKSQLLLDYILDYVDMVIYYRQIKNGYYYGYNVVEKELVIPPDRIDNFFKVLKNSAVQISWINMYKTYENCEFTDEEFSPKLKVTTDKKTGETVLSLDIKELNYIISDNNIYPAVNGKMYTVQKTQEILSLFKIFGDKDKIIIPKDKQQEFSTYVLPKWEKFLPENFINSEEKLPIQINKLASKMYLDVDDNQDITLKLTSCYNDAEFNILSPDYEDYIKNNNVIRNIEEEQKVLFRLFKDGFEIEPKKDYFILKDMEATYSFLTSKIDSYMNDFEVLVTDKLKNRTFKKPKISNIGVRIENNLLELDMSGIDMDLDEITNVLQSYTLKKKYYKLKNGDMLDLSPSEEMDLLTDISNNLDVDFRKLNQGKVKLPVNRSLYLEKMLSGKGITIDANDEYTSLINNIGDKNFSDSITVNEEFENVLRNYQVTGYKWLKVLDYYGFGGILADDMGLGKTLQIIAILWTYVSENTSHMPSIVVCPSSLVLNWKSEIEKWCPRLKVLIPSGVANKRHEIINACNKYDVVITSYDLLKRDIDKYEEFNFKYIIADEAQYIKNSATQNASALKALSGETRYALTGTPIENSVAELWSIFDYIMPNYLYNYNKFKKKFELPIIRDENIDALNKLKQMIEPFILRRIKTEVLTELPEKTITILKNEMTQEQQKLYISYMAQIKHQVQDELNENGFAKSKLKILMLLTRLRQICCHPSLFLEGYNGGSGKLAQCMDILRDVIASGHKVLLFSQYTSMFEILEPQLKKENIQYYKLTGDTPVSQRVDMVESFNKSENVKVFLISLKAGGTGLNLTGADVVMHYDPWWNLSSENQATDRAYRIGQKNNVQVYKFITTNSIEEKINALQEKKAKLSQDILSTEEKFINTLSKEEVMALFD